MSLPDEYDAYAGRLGAESKAKYQHILKSVTLKLPEYWEFEIVPGFFKQSSPDTDPLKFDYLAEDFGRVLSWEDTFAQLEKLNKSSADNVQYKVFFLARHGQGYHNLANAIYGQEAWDRKWSKLNGDGKLVWAPDPELTELGIQQAVDNGTEWGRQLSKGCKLPTKWFSSPFTRSIDTLINTWTTHIDISREKPLIKEDFRETIGIHTCDKRSPKSLISKKYEHLGFVIESGFEEEDVYFRDDYRETIEEQSLRINRSFQFIFNNYDDEVISITSHSGSIRAQLLVLNHREFSIGTGGMIPVFVKATKLKNNLKA